MLTDHGCFDQYLHRIGYLVHTGCVDCQAAVDDAELALFGCD